MSKKTPAVGTIRQRKKFAWFPRIVEGEKIWFTRYWVYERYEYENYYKLNYPEWYVFRERLV